MVSSDTSQAHLHPNLSDPIFATRYWINILIYIENVVVKFRTTDETSLRGLERDYLPIMLIRS